MVVLQRNARSLLPLRSIGNKLGAESSYSRALSQVLSAEDDLGTSDCRSRTYSVGSGTIGCHLPGVKRDGRSRLIDCTERIPVSRTGPHSGFYQAASFAASAVCQDAKHASSKEGAPPQKTTGQAFHDAGWTRQEVINIPNALSMGRLLSGPVVAHLILQHHWPAAMITLAVAGISDWADGYAAKHWGQSSVLGSYLDPLADKVLVGCTVGALAAEGSLPVALAAIIIGRDVLLVTGACVDRCRRIGWRRVGWAEFFRTAPRMPKAMPSTAGGAEGVQRQPQHGHASTPTAGAGQSQQQEVQGEGPAAQEEGNRREARERASPTFHAQSTSREDFAVPPAALVQPLYISKLNTVFQLGLIAGCISHSWYGWPSETVMWGLGGITAFATLASFAAYIQVYRQRAMQTKI